MQICIYASFPPPPHTNNSVLCILFNTLLLLLVDSIPVEIIFFYPQLENMFLGFFLQLHSILLCEYNINAFPSQMKQQLDSFNSFAITNYALVNIFICVRTHLHVNINYRSVCQIKFQNQIAGSKGNAFIILINVQFARSAITK